LVGIAIDGATGYGRAVMRGVMRYANLQRRWLIHEEFRPMSSLSNRWPRCDGAVAAGTSAATFEHIRRRSRHVVHCSSSGDPSQTPIVCLDDVAAGELAANHLLDCRLENFGFLGWGSPPTSANRAHGFVTALQRRGFSCNTCSVDWRKPNWRKLSQWVRALPKPIGVMAVDDTTAHDLAAACLEANIAVPDRVAIIGVNNDDLLCESAWPPLSSVEGDFSRIGYAAAGILDRLLNGETLRREERVVRLPPLGVVARLSTDVLAVDEPNVADAVRYIREHACDPCAVGDVLRHVPVARRWLERQFVQKLGRTPHDEIMRVRMEAARRLLLQINLSIPDVAARCGFSAVSNFGRAFAQAYAATPGAYRRASR